jgi:hypothetical protein
MATYKALVGIEYGDKRIEAGDTASDIPTKSVSWLTEQGLIELVEESNSKKSKVVVEGEAE